MTFSFKKLLVGFGIIAIALLLVAAVLWYFNRASTGNAPSLSAFFGSAQQNGGGGPGANSAGGGNEPLDAGASGTGTSSAATVFLIAGGPVVAGTLLDESFPTTTSARYITADDGHVLDVALDVPGAVPHVISQTTIPGVERAFFTDGGQGAILQYVQGATVKTVHLAFATATGTDAAPQTFIQFLPDNIESIAASPDGGRLAYLLRSAAGTDGYVSKSDGSGAKKIFALPLSDVVLSWTAPGMLIAYSKAAAGAPGIVFSVNALSGATTPLLYGQGITAIADAAFEHIVYQIADGTSMQTFIDATKDGSTAALPGLAQSALPEQCVVPGAPAAARYPILCAAPLSPRGGNFLDLWHQGAASAPDALIALDPAQNTASMLAAPGTAQGGESANIVGIGVAPRSNYALFINKNDGKLWGVRLGVGQ